MHSYSHVFSTLYDERGPVAPLGRGAHYSVLRACIWSPGLQFRDFAVIWDEDHDERVIWVAERMFEEQLLENVVALGERKGFVTVLTERPATGEFVKKVEDIAGGLPADCFSVSVEEFPSGGSIIQAERARVQPYLAGIAALWKLGSKPPAFSTRAFEPIPRE